MVSTELEQYLVISDSTAVSDAVWVLLHAECSIGDSGARALSKALGPRRATDGDDWVYQSSLTLLNLDGEYCWPTEEALQLDGPPTNKVYGVQTAW